MAGSCTVWHEACVQGYQEYVIIMDNELQFSGPYVYRAAHTVTYRAAHTVTHPLLSQMTKFTLSHFTTQSLQ